MHATLLLVILATAPDEFGPLILSADTEYLVHRLVKVENHAGDESLTWRSADQADFLTCYRLFPDCAEAVDEFQRKAAVERHRAELDALKADVARLKDVAVLGGMLCLGEYDFKKGGFPLSSLTLSSPGLRAPSPESPPATYPALFQPIPKTTKLVSFLKLPEARAEELRRISSCFQVRAEVRLPKPVRWVSNAMRSNDPSGIYTGLEPPAVVVELKRVRLIASTASGETLATY